MNAAWRSFLWASIQMFTLKSSWQAAERRHGPSVDFDDDLQPFYFDACGFTPTNAGLMAL